MALASQIRDKALKRLGIKGTGQVSQNEIKTDLDNAYKEVFAELECQTATSWDFDEEVPDEAVRHVVALVAYSRVDEYSVPMERYRRIVRDAEGDRARNKPSAVQYLRALRSEDFTETPTATYY